MRSSRSSRSSLLAARAQALRSFPTLSEQRLWQELRGSRLGVPFRRQVVIAGFIADFAAPSVGLVVEVDGECHERRRARDARRDRKLERAGYRVLRLPAEVVLRDLPRALALIRAAL